jgi:DNA replication and repair protein RecF
MRIERLTLRRFRNVRDSGFEPGPGINLLLGQNGQGKTSFLEAIGYLALLRSFRGSKTPEVIQWDATDAEIICKLATRSEPSLEPTTPWETELKITFAFVDPARQRANKVAFINGKPYRSSTQYLCQRFGNFVLGFHAVVFNPSDHDLVRGDPATRRAYLDRVIAAEDEEYLQTLQRYQKILEQRNAVLKNSDRPERHLLAGFTEPLIRAGALLSLKRLEWIHRLLEPLNNAARGIAPRQPPLRLAYLSNWVPEIEGLSITNNSLTAVHFAGHGTLPSLELLEQSFWKKQSSVESAEWRTGHSLVGPHRDDWTFFLGGQVLKGHGSQGEVRSALLALKLSEIELFQTATGHRPVFLLDDFSSELDQERRAFLLEFLSKKDLQVFITTTDDAFLSKALPDSPAVRQAVQKITRFRVINGELRIESG